MWVTNSMLPNTGTVEIANEKTLVDYVIAGGFFVLLLGIVGGYSFGEARFSLKSPQPLPSTGSPSEKITCQYCDSQNMSDAMFCHKCGKKIPNIKEWNKRALVLFCFICTNLWAWSRVHVAIWNSQQFYTIISCSWSETFKMVDCPECGKPLRKGTRKGKYFCENDTCSVIFVRRPDKELLMEIVHRSKAHSALTPDP